MKKNPETIKALAQALSSHPEWTGSSGVFFNRFSGYVGVKIFSQYVKHLKMANGNKVPGALTHKARDFVDYLNELPDDQKEQYSSYFKNVVPKIYNMIRDAKMTKESILVFANIFSDLEIGSNPATVIADYQSAISDAFKFKMHSAGGTGDTSKQDETYHRLALSDSEKADIIQKCSQKGVMISSSQLDGYYIGSGGSIYSEDGTAVENPAIGAAIAQTLQYQVSIGNAAKMALTEAEITEILAICERKGIKITKEDLENTYIDKDGQLYSGDGKMITDVALGTAIKQTKTYADAYNDFADKRGESTVAEVPPAEGEREEPAIVVPEKIQDLAQQIKPLVGTEKTTDKAAQATSKGEQGAEQTARTARESRGLSSIGGEMPQKSRIQMPRIVPVGNPNDRTRQLQGDSKGRISEQGSPEEQQSQQQEQQQAQQQAQAQQQTQPQPTRKRAGSGSGETSGPSRKEDKKGFPWLRIGGICGGTWAGGKYVYSATFFIPTNLIDTHSFIYNILTIIFQ